MRLSYVPNNQFHPFQNNHQIIKQPQLIPQIQHSSMVPILTPQQIQKLNNLKRQSVVPDINSIGKIGAIQNNPNFNRNQTMKKSMNYDYKSSLDPFKIQLQFYDPTYHQNKQQRSKSPIKIPKQTKRTNIQCSSKDNSKNFLKKALKEDEQTNQQCCEIIFKNMRNQQDDQNNFKIFEHKKQFKAPQWKS